jgi:hypothetical protein
MPTFFKVGRTTVSEEEERLLSDLASFLPFQKEALNREPGRFKRNLVAKSTRFVMSKKKTRKPNEDKEHSTTISKNT